MVDFKLQSWDDNMELGRNEHMGLSEAYRDGFQNSIGSIMEGSNLFLHGK